MKTKYKFGGTIEALKNGPFTTVTANKYGITRSDLRHGKGFLKIGETTDVLNPKTGTVVHTSVWVYDEQLYKLKRQAHRNPSKYLAIYDEESKKYQNKQQ